MAQVSPPADDSGKQAPLTERERALLQRVDELERRLAILESKQQRTNPETVPKSVPTQIDNSKTDQILAVQADAASLPKQAEEGKKSWGTYTPNLGFKLASTEYGDVNFSLYTYVRYLNQLATDPTFTNAFGTTTDVVRRQNIQLLKVNLKFLGWVMNPKLRYFVYGWTSNASQGLGAQVVLGGYLTYAFSKYFTLGAGINSLPGTRSLEGNYPYWLSVDSRLIADEFFRPSYTSGIFFRGELTDKLRYQVMLGNNLSQLGVSAVQLDNGLNTVASALVWMPTTGEFGQGFGDFEDHEKLATRVGFHFTRSDETKQSQPGSEQFENTQIRLADGSIIFTPNLFAPGITVNAVTYKMSSVDAGVKKHGLSLEGEYYWRWLDNFTGPGTSGLPRLFDHGFQLQASAMLIPKTLQFYTGGSTIKGKYGNPYDVKAGLNVFPFKSRTVRWNTEGLYVYKSPSGYTSAPYNVGSNGFIFHTNLELAF